MILFGNGIGRARETGLVKRRPIALFALALAAALSAVPAARADFMQQGDKLVGTGFLSGQPGQGGAVAVSADGNTMAVGANADGFNNGGTQVGAVWVYTRSNGVWTQQGPKLVGTGGTAGSTNQGSFVGLSADGNTLMEGGYGDNSGVGAVWVFTRSNGVWTQQGGKLVPSDVIGAPSFQAGAISADGNTLIVGGSNDNGVQGAAWIFTRSGGVWTQQAKLIGTGVSGTLPFQGTSVAISGDGNTAASGGPIDGSGGQFGAVWVFTRSGSTWTQQGSKLTVTGGTGTFVRFGSSVALSSDGDTLIGGGPFDNYDGANNAIGASWVFTRSGGVWTQQGNKLVGTGGGVRQYQGRGVGLSGDGNTAIVGGPDDNSFAGAAWIFTRSGGVWAQTGAKLVGTGAVGNAQQGTVAISRDGSTALSGGFKDNAGIGAVWAFIQGATLAAAHDFNGDGRSDILWRDTGGNTAIWLMNGGAVSSNASLGNVPASWSVAGQRDFNGGARHDILWRDSSGTVAMWLMNGGTVASNAVLDPPVPTSWTVVGTGDFDGDGQADILWRNDTGELGLWFMSGATLLHAVNLGIVPTDWTVVETGDFNGDGKRDILWRNTDGQLGLWLMNGAAMIQGANYGVIPAVWTVAATGDFDGDGKSDILWRDSSGNIAMWLMNGVAVSSNASLGNVATSWSIAQTGDYDGGGKSDILWRNSNGDTAMWLMNGGAVSSVVSLGNVGTSWAVQGINAD